MLKSIALSRSRVWVIEAATRSTLPLTRSGMRVGEVTLTSSTGTPIRSPILRTRSMSKPTGSFLSLRNPNGGVSSFTPASSLPRSLILASVPCGACAVAAKPVAKVTASARNGARKREDAVIVFPQLGMVAVKPRSSRYSDARNAIERVIELAIRAGERQAQMPDAAPTERGARHRRHVDLIEPAPGDIDVRGLDRREQIERGGRQAAADAGHRRKPGRRGLEPGPEHSSIGRHQLAGKRQRGDAGDLNEAGHAVDRVLNE